MDPVSGGHGIERAAIQSIHLEQFMRHIDECPLCGQSRTTATELFTVLQLCWEVAVLRCRRCGLAYKEYVPNDLIMNRLYGTNYEHFRQPLDVKGEIPKYRSRVKRMGRPRGRHLDYGCGAGYFVACALQSGWDSYGADPYLPNVSAIPGGSGRLFRGEVADSAVREKLGLFDCISLWAVFEHITPLGKTLDALVKMLNPGGRLILNSPDANSLIARQFGRNWRMAVLLEHIQFCSRTCAQWIADQNKLTIRSLRIAGSPFPLGTVSSQYNDQRLGSFTNESNKACKVEEGHSTDRSEAHDYFRNPHILSSLANALLADGGNGLSAMIIRKAIHGLRLGDHIEIAFVRC